MKFNIVLFCAFHCTFDDFVSNYYIRKFAKARMILENLSLSVTCPQLINLHQQFFFFFFLRVVSPLTLISYFFATSSKKKSLCFRYFNNIPALLNFFLKKIVLSIFIPKILPIIYILK